MPRARGRRAQKAEEKYIKFKPDNEELEEHQEEEVKQKFQPNSSVPQETVMNTPFFGLVDSSELDYFKQCESTLNISAFDNDDEKRGFINSIFEEAKGKELKLVTNQICSKLVERLILNSSDKQLKSLFKAFNGNFVSLSHHKYSSHCLETLLVRSAALTEKELIIKEDMGEEQIEDEEEYVSMENLFLFMLAELKPNLQSMISHQYSSHVLRLILLILSGRELPSSVLSNSTLRSKKSKIARKMIEIKDNDDFSKQYQIPPSFKSELSDILQIILKNQDRVKLRELSIHKIASPVIQLIIQVEGLVDKERTFWHTIFLNVNEPKDEKEGGFVEYLLSDSIGSHFLESVIKCERPKYIERLYRLYMKERILKLAKRETTGSFVIKSLLLKLKHTDVVEILDSLIPELSELINNNLELGSTILDSSISNNDYKKPEIIEQILLRYSTANDEEFLEKILNLSSSTLGNTRDDWPTAEERRKSFFLEKLITYDDIFVRKTILSLLSLPKERLLQMCFHGVFSHVVESILLYNVDNALKRRLLNLFQGEITSLACNSYGSHIVDKLWTFTARLNVYKERIAQELLDNNSKIKESIYGKLVWKNWSMELFTRRKSEWKGLAKLQEEELFKNDEKKPIDLKIDQLMKQKNGVVDANENFERDGFSTNKFGKRSIDELLPQKKRSRGRR